MQGPCKASNCSVLCVIMPQNCARSCGCRCQRGTRSLLCPMVAARSSNSLILPCPALTHRLHHVDLSHLQHLCAAGLPRRSSSKRMPSRRGCLWAVAASQPSSMSACSLSTGGRPKPQSSAERSAVAVLVVRASSELARTSAISPSRGRPASGAAPEDFLGRHRACGDSSRRR